MIKHLSSLLPKSISLVPVMAPKKSAATKKAEAKAAAKAAAKKAFLVAAEKGKKDDKSKADKSKADKSKAGTSVPSSSSAAASSAAASSAGAAPEPSKRETQGFLMYLKGAIAGKDVDKANQAGSILKRYQELSEQPNAKRQMIQEFWKQGGGKGKGLQCLHEQAYTYTEKAG